MLFWNGISSKYHYYYQILGKKMNLIPINILKEGMEENGWKTEFIYAEGWSESDKLFLEFILQLFTIG